MASKQVTDREKSTRFVLAALDTHATTIQAAFEKRFAGALRKGEKSPDLALLAALVARVLDATTATLVEADRRHEAELADDAGPRTRRDEHAQQVYQTLVDLRAAVGASLGQEGLRVLGLDHATPEDPSVLLNEGTATLGKLRDKGLELPGPRRKGISFEPSEFAEELQAHLTPLRQSLADVARETREGDRSLHDKRQAMAAHDESFSLGASWLSATLSLVGLDELASRVRPAPRRPGQVEDAGEPAPAPAGPSS
ncbi:MAG: hypothetical protein EOO75_03755 [Myxococcales bacterium]|nr:MAG: hypothetical protein EOO75_03755 [Myxococcales bacterium]